MPSWPCGSREKVENVKRFTDRQADGQTDKQKGRQTDDGQKVIKKAQGELKSMASISWMSIRYRIQIHSVKCGNQQCPDSFTALQPNIHCVVIIKSLPYDWSKSYVILYTALLTGAVLQWYIKIFLIKILIWIEID